jgi:Uma2 family endonuclease
MDTTRLAGLTVADLPEEEVGTRHELIDGGLLVSPNPTVRHQGIVTALLLDLTSQLAVRKLNWRVLAGVNVIPDSQTLLIPDIAVITAEAFVKGGLSVMPSDLRLVVEVESPSTRRWDRTLKRELYAEWAVPYWIVNPEARTVATHEVGMVWLVVPEGIFD